MGGILAFPRVDSMRQTMIESSGFPGTMSNRSPQVDPLADAGCLHIPQ